MGYKSNNNNNNTSTAMMQQPTAVVISSQSSQSSCEPSSPTHQPQQQQPSMSKLDMLLETQGQRILEKVNRAHIFQTLERRSLPTFEREELTFGKVLGTGGFGIVREVTAIQLSEQALPDDADDDAQLQKYTMSQRCIRNGTHARYAVKYLKHNNSKDILMTAQGRIDLAVEIQFLQVLSHPNIVKMRGYYATDNALDGQNFFVMDRLYGTLDDKIVEWKHHVRELQMKQKKLRTSVLKVLTAGKSGKKLQSAFHAQWMERLLVAYDIASALRYMHLHKLVYRDLKPENIGFDVRGDVKIFDFGLAKPLNDDVKTNNGFYKLTGCTGSIPYMAPEVAQSQPYHTSADVYSFGVLLFELLSLSDAYPKVKSRCQYVHHVVTMEQRPCLKEKSWPESVQQLLTNAWEASPKQRWSMAKVCSSLQEELLSNEQAPLIPQETIRQRSKFLKEQSSRSLRGLTTRTTSSGRSY